MSYSRWSNSSWYTFWAVRGEELLQGNINEEVFAGWYDMDNTIDWTFEEVNNLLSKEPDDAINLIQLKYDCSPDEANELQEYMQEWRADVRKEYTLL
jgi:hypothetical protein